MRRLHFGQRAVTSARSGRPRRRREFHAEVFRAGLCDRCVPSAVAVNAAALAFPFLFTRMLSEQLRLPGMREFVNDEIVAQPRPIRLHKNKCAFVQSDDMAVAENEGALAFGSVVVARVAVVRTEFDRSEHHADVEGVELNCKQRCVLQKVSPVALILSRLPSVYKN